MYIAEVLQDPNAEEAGSGSGEDDGQGSSQDEEIINVQNGLNADFQSGEDSLIDNEVRHWSWDQVQRDERTDYMWIKHGAEPHLDLWGGRTLTNTSTLSTVD